MTAHDGERVAAARVGERDAGVGGNAEDYRHPRHDFEGNALLVQEQRFLAAAIEDERVALLEARHDLAFARLLGQQEADRVLVGGFAGRAAHVDALGPARGQIEDARVHRVVVDHDVGRTEAALAPGGDETGCARTRANQIHQRLHRGAILSRGLASAGPRLPAPVPGSCSPIAVRALRSYFMTAA